MIKEHTIHIMLHPQSAVGKTLIARLLAEYLNDRGCQTVFHYEYLKHSKGYSYQDFEDVIDKLLVGDFESIVDVDFNIAHGFAHWCEYYNLDEIAARKNRAILFHTIIPGGYAFKSSFKWAINTVQSMDYSNFVVWFNCHRDVVPDEAIDRLQQVASESPHRRIQRCEIPSFNTPYKALDLLGSFCSDGVYFQKLLDENSDSPTAVTRIAKARKYVYRLFDAVQLMNIA